MRSYSARYICTRAAGLFISSRCAILCFSLSTCRYGLHMIVVALRCSLQPTADTGTPALLNRVITTHVEALCQGNLRPDASDWRFMRLHGGLVDDGVSHASVAYKRRVCALKQWSLMLLELLFGCRLRCLNILQRYLPCGVASLARYLILATHQVTQQVSEDRHRRFPPMLSCIILFLG
jgi:hypothetical protein